MPKLPKEIEERFDDYFPKLVHQDRLGEVIGSQIKSFIATLLDEERKKIIKKIEKYKDTRHNQEAEETIDDLLNLIKEDE